MCRDYVEDCFYGFYFEIYKKRRLYEKLSDRFLMFRKFYYSVNE